MTTRRRINITRDMILFVVGLAGIINEAARHGTERVGLLVLFAGMVGLPAFIPKDPPPVDNESKP